MWASFNNRGVPDSRQYFEHGYLAGATSGAEWPCGVDGHAAYPQQACQPATYLLPVAKLGIAAPSLPFTTPALQAPPAHRHRLQPPEQGLAASRQLLQRCTHLAGAIGIIIWARDWSWRPAVQEPVLLLHLFRLALRYQYSAFCTDGYMPANVFGPCGPATARRPTCLEGVAGLLECGAHQCSLGAGACATGLQDQSLSQIEMSMALPRCAQRIFSGTFSLAS